ncbi:MAG: class I SAM-dependent methyltransferase [Rhodobacteraceae bacterium]|nr:class I SAM-dependent methyltransferase [Paracoccaceae bacterium]
MSSVDTTYETYADDPGYIAANAALIGEIDLTDVTRVADLACGTGLLSRQLLARDPGLVIAGIDLDPIQIEIAGRMHGEANVNAFDSLDAWRAAAGTGKGGVHLNVASAMELPFADNEIDLVTIGNAIHMMPDLPAFLNEVARVLRPGGQLVFNSVFYAGTFIEGTEPVFTECLKEAVLVMTKMNAERRAAGERPIPRIRGTVGRAFQTDWLNAKEWGEAVNAAGFSVKSSGDRVMPISTEAMQAICSYGGLAEVLMSGYPVDIASQCLHTGIGNAFKNLDIEEVPRNWLEIIAVLK